MSSAGEYERIEKHLYILRALMDRDGLTLPQALEEHAYLVPQEDHEAVLRMWERRHPSTVIRVLYPTELSPGGPRPWFNQWDTSRGYYWGRQRRYLRHVLHREEHEIDNTDRSSDRVLAHLEHPNHDEPFRVKGLVVGHVQSGKTGNFSALIAKAADSGYKIVIVLSGLHNTLRQQTQRRLQRELGHEDSPEGVGQGDPDKWWTWMTNDRLDGDFDPRSNAGTLQGSNQVILVVKKNKSRLDRLLEWMENKVPAEVAVLVIDDEADQASINTGGNRPTEAAESLAESLDLTSADFDGEVLADDEIDPSAINLRVRKLLGLFARCSYVAYTATPFANVLINPNADDREGGEDLFPRNFILTLPHPPGEAYVGPERLFGREQLPGEAGDLDGIDVIRIVPDFELERLVAPRNRRETFTPAVTPSLRSALLDFLLAAAGRLARSKRDCPCTMLVHVDMRKEAQDKLAAEIGAELGRMRQQWRYDRPQFLPQLRTRWETDFRPLISSVDIERDMPFEELEIHLDEILTPGLDLRILNSNHLDEIDFDLEPNLKAVLVGGNKLSRGVTVEGLLVSYFVRRSLYYDTLLQMGRWFGYRGDHVDLTRLYSTQQLISWFHDLATIEEELRRQIEHYARRGLGPKEVAPRIRSHEKMLPTAKAKMKDSRFELEPFDGRKLQTLRFSFDDPKTVDLFTENLEVARTLLVGLGHPHDVDPGHLGWNGVPAGSILKFIENFRFGDQQNFDQLSVMRYIQAQNRLNELIAWRVLVSHPRTNRADTKGVDLGVEGHPEVAMMRRSRLSKDPTSLGVVTEPDDELFGLTDEQIDYARRLHDEGEFTKLGDAFRSQRDPGEGLLVLYPIDPESGPGKNAVSRKNLFAEGAVLPECVMAYAISFPYTQSEAGVPYVVGEAAQRS